jgi:apolipoprotein N-acyltransferase
MLPTLPMSLPLALASVLLSAALSGLAFPPHGLAPLAFVGLVPFLLALRGASAARAAGLAWLWGELFAWSVAGVFPGSLASYFERPLWFGLLVGMLIFTLMSSLYYVVFALAQRLLTRSHSLVVPLVTAAAWVSVELARGRLFTGSAFFIGNPWGLFGYTHSSGALAQIASWGGVYGISFAIVAVNAGLAGWFVAWRDPDRSTRAGAIAALLAALPVIAFTIGGAISLVRAPDPTDGEGLIEVAVVQGNVAVGRRWRSEYYGKNLDVYLDLTRQALQQGSPRLVVWPEGAMNFYLETEPLYRDAIARLLEAGDVELLAGGPGADEDKHPQIFNSVFLVAPDGQITARYDKQLLMPFSEYLPFRQIDLMKRQREGPRTFLRGAADPAPLETRLGRIGLLVCNEAMLPEVAAARVRAGAEILVSPSNDSWIVGEGFAEHMLALISLRAIEQRRYVIRASTSGPSAVVDPWGRIPVRTDTFRPHLLLGGVRPETGLTLYAQVGDAFAVACTLVVAGTLVRLLITRRSRN